MSRGVDIGGWMLVIFGVGLGLLAGWMSDLHLLTENTATAAAYTTAVFACLALALRPAWRKLRLWADLAILLMLHVALGLPLVTFLNSHSVRLNWGIALPFVAIEFLFLLGLLWRRNVPHSESPPE